jgi:hypothetical protein
MPIMTNNEPARTEPAPADQDWFGGRRWTGIAAIGFLILVVLCVVVVLIVNHGKNKSTGTTAAGNSPSATGASSSPASALPTTVPSTAPSGVTWSIYQTVALPSLPGVGPSKVSGAIATGYSHTPLGALLATANESYRYALAPDNEWRQAAAAMLAPSGGTDAWLKVRASHPYGSGGGDGADQLAQIAGYQFVSYTSTDAVIQIVTKDSDGNLQVGANHVSWSGSDWRFVPGPDGGQAANVQQVDSLAGFIEWRGV